MPSQAPRSESFKFQVESAHPLPSVGSLSVTGAFGEGAARRGDLCCFDRGGSIGRARVTGVALGLRDGGGRELGSVTLLLGLLDGAQAPQAGDWLLAPVSDTPLRHGAGARERA